MSNCSTYTLDFSLDKPVPGSGAGSVEKMRAVVNEEECFLIN